MIFIALNKHILIIRLLSYKAKQLLPQIKWACAYLGKIYTYSGMNRAWSLKKQKNKNTHTHTKKNVAFKTNQNQNKIK